MLANLKQKRLVPLWDRLMYTRYFEVSLDASLPDCVERLSSLAQPRQWRLASSSRAVQSQKNSDDRYEFQIDQFRYGGMSRRGIKITGTMYWDSNQDKTIIKSKFTSHFLMFWLSSFLILMCIVLLFQMDVGLILIFFSVLFVPTVWLDWRVVRSDYRKLQALMYQALQQR